MDRQDHLPQVFAQGGVMAEVGQPAFDGPPGAIHRCARFFLVGARALSERMDVLADAGLKVVFLSG